MKDIISNRMMDLRVNETVSKYRVATDLGMNPSHYQRLEGGEVEPKLGTARKIARYFKVHIDDIWPEAGE